MRSKALSLWLLLAALPACNRGGSSPPPPSLEIAFPPPFVATDADSLLVRGRAAGVAPIASVTVGTVPATTADGFATWQARIPLTMDEQVVPIEVTDGLGRTARIDRTVVRHAVIPARPRGIAVDAGNRRYYLVDDALDTILSIEPTNGARSVVSAATVGAGPELLQPAGAAFEPTTGRIVVADEQRGLVFVDPASGDRTELPSSVQRAVAIALLDPSHALVVEARLYLSVVLEPANLVRVDLTDGARTLLSSAGGGSGFPSAGTGPGFEAAIDVVPDPSGTIAYVLDADLDAVIRVDLATGDRTILSGPGVGAGPDLEQPTAAALDETRSALLVTDGSTGSVLAIDLATGDRALASGVGAGAGIDLLAPSAVVRDPATGMIAVVDLERDTVVSIDPATGDRRALFEVTHGVGPAFRWPGAVVVDPGFGHLWVVDETDGSLLGVQPETGSRQRIHPRVGPGLILRLSAPRGVDTDASDVLILDESRDALFGIDLFSSTLRTVSGPTTGTGPPLLDPFDLVIEAASDTALVTSERELLRVDRTSGDRTVVSSDSVGGGPTPLRLLGLAIDQDRGRLLAIDATYYRVGDASYTLLGIDPSTGDRTSLADWYRTGVWHGDPRRGGTDRIRVDTMRDRVIVADPLEQRLLTVDLTSNDVGEIAGAGVRLCAPRGLAIAASGDCAFVTDADRRAILAVDLETGERAIVSL